MNKVEQYNVITDVQGRLLDETDVLIFLRDYFNMSTDCSVASAVAKILTRSIDSFTDLSNKLDRLSFAVLPAEKRQNELVYVV